MSIAGKARQKIFSSLRSLLGSPPQSMLLQETVDELVRQTDQLTDVISIVNRNEKSLSKYGKQVFSQSDEDGITLEIVQRLFDRKGVVVEIGVGDGIENNSLVLLALGWRAVWVGNEDLGFAVGDFAKSISYTKSWVTKDNIFATVKQGCRDIDSDFSMVDILMVDLDGNDFYVTEALLDGGMKPSVLVLEYNSYLPPPIDWKMEYNAENIWVPPSLNYGASLQAYVNLLSRRGYFLVACNAQTGNNAFFVKNELTGKFGDVSREIGDLYVGRAQNVYNTPHNKKKLSRDFIESVLRSGLKSQ
ncbi:MAG: hypothetical protein ACO3AI_06100 [Ilumatobacteraceae bacterium]